MSDVDVFVVVSAAALIALLAWFFFVPKPVRFAQLKGGVQEVAVTVKGAHTPDRIRVRQGVPLRLVFNRQASGDCTARVVFPEFGVSRRTEPGDGGVIRLLVGRDHPARDILDETLLDAATEPQRYHHQPG